jgi:hypothetical protein
MVHFDFCTSVSDFIFYQIYFYHFVDIHREIFIEIRVLS